MKKYLQFIKEAIEDIDPFMEEIWDHEPFEVGDIVICVNDSGGVILIERGAEYEIVGIDNIENRQYLNIKQSQGCKEDWSLNGKPVEVLRRFNSDRFVKKKI